MPDPMQILIDELNKASDAYYNGKEIMSNKEFDEKFDQLKKMEADTGTRYPDSPTIKVGAPVTGDLPKFKHPYPARSLDKTKDIDEFVGKFRKGLEEAGGEVPGVVLMFKEDGSTVQAYYKAGILDKLVTRGNGEVGSVITHNVDCIEGLPKTIPYEIDLVVRGEAVMSYQEFERINEQLPEDQKYANPRNLAAATLQMIDPNEAKKRKLMFQAFNLVHISKAVDPYLEQSFFARLEFLEKIGFNVVPHLLSMIDGLAKAVDMMTDKVKEYEYPVDGLVAALNNYAFASTLQGTEHHPHVMQGYAFKWADETKETVLREIEWSPSRTGLLNPVAIFDPIELEGTTVKRASLHNLSIMRELNVKVGDRITVYKANMIVPQVDQNLDKESHPNLYDSYGWIIGELITQCPTCGCTVTINRSAEGIETVCCPNLNCPEKLIGKLAHFCERDCMDIQGMSEDTIAKLVNAGFIKEYKDFFELDQKPGISFLPGFGKQSWRKMCEASKKSQKTDFVRFITAIGITNIGKGQAKTLCKYLSDHYDDLVNYLKVSSYNLKGDYDLVGLLFALSKNNFDFTVIEGFGSIMDQGLKDWVKDHTVEGSPEVNVLEVLSFTDTRPSENSSSGKLSGKSFCITGKLIHHANRQALVDVIESNGGKWVDSVSSKTDYLINNDVTSTSGKNKKAKDLGIPIISEEQFNEMLLV